MTDLQPENHSSIAKEQRLLKQLYFWSFVAFGMISPFAVIFFKRVLVDTNGEPDVRLVGIILSLASVTGFIANLVTGYLSDKLQKGRHIISWLCLIAFGSAIIVGFCGEPTVMNLPLSARFSVLMIAVLLYRFTMMPLNALLDSETMQFLSQNGDRSQFGSYRFWGTIGWAVATPIMGFLLWHFNDYKLIHYVGAFAYLVFGYLGLKSTGKATVSKVSIPWNHLRKDRPFQLFLIFAFITGVVENATSNYIGYFFDDVMTTPLRTGMIFSIWTALEIPVMIYSKKLIDLFGNRGLVITGLILGAIKLVLFSFFTLETPFYFQLIAALIHGPAFALLFLGTIDIADRLAHDSMRATYMSVTAIARYTLAGAVGGWLGAEIISLVGGAKFMQIGAIGMLLLVPLFLITVRTGTTGAKKS